MYSAMTMSWIMVQSARFFLDCLQTIVKGYYFIARGQFANHCEKYIISLQEGSVQNIVRNLFAGEQIWSVFVLFRFEVFLLDSVVHSQYPLCSFSSRCMTLLRFSSICFQGCSFSCKLKNGSCFSHCSDCFLSPCVCISFKSSPRAVSLQPLLER